MSLQKRDSPWMLVWPRVGSISPFESMAKQLKGNGICIDDKSQYKFGGLIKPFCPKKLELLLLETSGHLSNSDKIKVNFDPPYGHA